MKRILYGIFFGCVALVTLPACDSFLDVVPEDKFTKEQAYSSETGINTVLNGLYMQAVSGELYGQQMTMTILEVLGQRYNQSNPQNYYYNLSLYNYNDAGVKTIFDNLWTKSYSTILQVNDFIVQLQKVDNHVIPEQRRNILLGEAYGLRGFLHFDLLRLFGPMYSSKDSLSLAIPYNSTADGKMQPIIPANAVIDSVLVDMAIAESLLSSDPVITEGVVNTLSGDPVGDYYKKRNLRFNYYAVKALQARIYMYRNDKNSALKAAMAVIEAPNVKTGSHPFPWLPYVKIISEKKNPDRIFSTEVIFGIFNDKMYSSYDSYFSGAVGDLAILAPFPARLASVYESNENDYRYPYLWMVPTEGGKEYRTFFKYAPPVNIDQAFSYVQPLIRISEMYYIAAECETDKTKAVNYINKVRYNRGLADLATTVNVTTELRKEYMKEFYGEGQLFFYYKRTATTAIPNGNSTSGNVTMNAAKYVVPLPDSETSLR